MTLADNYPVTSRDNCLVGQVQLLSSRINQSTSFISKPGSPFVSEFVKFERESHVELVGCNIGNKLVALGGREDDVTADSKSGFRYSCINDAQGVHLTAVVCVVRRTAIAIRSQSPLS